MRRSLPLVLSALFLLAPATVLAQSESTAKYPHNSQLSWVPWWEANREPYLLRAIGERAPDPATDPRDPAAVDTAAGALRTALKSENPFLRAEAVVALARVDRNAKPDVLPLTTDFDIRVRRRAWLALGLLDEESELLRTEDLPTPELEAVAAGLALVDRLGPPGFERLRRWADHHESWQVQRMALFALRAQHAARFASQRDPVRSRPADNAADPDPAPDRALAFQALRNSTHPVIVAEAIASLGTLGRGDPDTRTALLAIISGDPQTLSLPLFRADLALARRHNITSLRATMGLRAIACYALGELLDLDPTAARPYDTLSATTDPTPTPPQPGSNRQLTARTTPALSQPNTQDNAGHTLEALLTQSVFRRHGDLEPYGGYRVRAFIYPEAATIPLARTSRGDALANLLNLAHATLFGPNYLATRYVYEPQRANAAIALGIFYTNPANHDAQLTSVTAHPGDAALGRVPEGRSSSSSQPQPSRGGGRLAPGAETPTALPGTAVVGALPTADGSVNNALNDLGDVLLNRARLDTETEGLRSACALATGLAGQRFRAGSLADMTRRLDARRFPLLTGNIALALALLDDPRAADLARLNLAPPFQRLDPAKLAASVRNDAALSLNPDYVPVAAPAITGLLGARASLTAVATLRDPRAAQLLQANWGANVFLSQESARAMRWCAAYDAIPAFAALTAQTDKPNLAALAARSLGEVLDRDRLTPRLHRMIQPHSFNITAQGPAATPADAARYTAAVNAGSTPGVPALIGIPAADLHALAQPLLYNAASTWMDIHVRIQYDSDIGRAALPR